MGDRQQPGKPITARIINTLARTAERLLSSSQQPPTQQTSFIGGVYEAAERDPKFWAKLTGSANPYDVKEQVGTAGGGWADLSGGRSCTACGYEVNSVASLTGKVVQVEPALDAKTYNFRYKKVNLGCTGQICVTVKGCNSAVLPGATVHIKQSGVDIAGSPCTTNSLGQCCISITAAGSYDITASATHFTTSSTVTISATCTTNNRTITLSPNGTSHCEACDSRALPNSLTLTHSGGSLTLVYNAQGGNLYYGCATYSMSGAIDDRGSGGALPCVAGTPTVPVQFWFNPCANTLTGQSQLLEEAPTCCDTSVSPATFGGYTDTHYINSVASEPIVCLPAGSGQVAILSVSSVRGTALATPTYGPLNVSFSMPAGSSACGPGAFDVVPFSGTITVTE